MLRSTQLTRTCSLLGLSLALCGPSVWSQETAPSPTRPRLALQIGHTDIISDSAFSPDGRTLATSSGDGTAKLWDVATGGLRDTLAVKTPALALGYSPDGGSLAIVGRDSGVEIWDARRGVLKQTLSVPRLRQWMDLHMVMADGIMKLTISESKADNYKVSPAALSEVKFSPDGRVLRRFEE